MPDLWTPGVIATSPIHADLATLLSPQKWSSWPDADALNTLLVSGARSVSGHRLHFVLSKEAGMAGAAEYERTIAASGAIPTRPECWHDFFNALVWALFPLTKSALNSVHVREGAQPGHNRSSRRDAITLLDECGVILPVADQRLTADHVAHRWHELFCRERGAWGRRIAPMIIGHGLYEQCLSPYVGLTAKALHVPVPAAWFGQPLAVRYRQMDVLLADRIGADDCLMDTSDLLPLPVLGVPGWWPGNRDPGFYDQQNYFRPRRN